MTPSRTKAPCRVPGSHVEAGGKDSIAEVMGSLPAYGPSHESENCKAIMIF